MHATFQSLILSAVSQADAKVVDVSLVRSRVRKRQLGRQKVDLSAVLDWVAGGGKGTTELYREVILNAPEELIDINVLKSAARSVDRVVSDFAKEMIQHTK
jgi:hypothetical protein